MYRTKKKRRGRRKERLLGLACLTAGLMLVAAPVKAMLYNHEVLPVKPNEEFRQRIEKFAEENELLLSDWPEELIRTAEKNPEMQDFVLRYPMEKDVQHEIDLSEYQNSETVPLLFQWDERWGYEEYAGETVGVSGCGPVCLSMVSMYLLNDTSYDPRYVAEFAKENGYAVDGSGSAWSLIYEGGRQLGLDVIEIPLQKKRVMRNLEVGNPVICIMGPGDFTTTGHFIVMTGCEDGKIKVNDPNSRRRSEMLWDFDEIKSQIRNLWVCR